MPRTSPTKEEILAAIRAAARSVGRAPSRSQFSAETGFSEGHVCQHFAGWREAVRAAGLEPNTVNVRKDDAALLVEWGEFVRKARQIPTVRQYKRDGKTSPNTFEKHFGAWSGIPDRFTEFAKDKPDWADVVALLPVAGAAAAIAVGATSVATVPPTHFLPHSHAKLDDRPTYGGPMDFRGLRHEPVNEQGVVFLFGMVARELGYMVEAVQTGFPDCEAKRQVSAGKWQRVRIEFEFESRNFRDHGHPASGCDLIVCWRHNWPDCPPGLEVVELSRVVKTLARSED